VFHGGLLHSLPADRILVVGQENEVPEELHHAYNHGNIREHNEACECVSATLNEFKKKTTMIRKKKTKKNCGYVHII